MPFRERLMFAVKQKRGRVAHLILPHHMSALCGQHIAWPQAWPKKQPLDKTVCKNCQAHLKEVENRQA